MQSIRLEVLRVLKEMAKKIELETSVERSSIPVFLLGHRKAIKDAIFNENDQKIYSELKRLQHEVLTKVGVGLMSREEMMTIIDAAQKDKDRIMSNSISGNVMVSTKNYSIVYR